MATGLSTIDGLVSGLNTSSVISQLMAIERRPQQFLQQRLATVNRRIDAFGTLKGSTTAVNSAATALDRALDWQAFTVTSSDETLAKASAGVSALTGRLSFIINNLAEAGASITSGAVSSTASVVASGNILLSKGADVRGFSSLANGVGLATGKHTIEVTQASSAASKSGTALALPVTITAGVNDSINIALDGTPASTYTIAPGSYTTGSDLATAVQTAVGNSFSVSGNGNALTLTTVDQGSAATLQVTGGSSLASLGFSTDAVALTGTDAVVKLAGNATTVTDVRTGQTVNLSDGSGNTLAATIGSGGISIGTLDTYLVGTGTGSMADVVNAINATSDSGITAAAVQTTPGSYQMQLSSTTTGAGSNITIDSSQFSGIGSLQTLFAGTDSQITVGTGPGAYTYESATNEVKGLLSGVTISLAKTSASVVTIEVGQDSNGLADKIQSFVDAANAAINSVETLSKYNTETSKAQPLTGDAVARRFLQDIYKSVSAQMGANSIGSAGMAGVSIEFGGGLNFNREKFIEAFTADPQGVTTVFTQGGTSPTSGIGFSSAGDRTVDGDYAVNITTASQQAQTTGSVLGGGTITAAEVISLRIGTNEVSYSASPGETLTNIVSGINNAMSQKGLGLSASISGNALHIKSAQYGASTQFEVKTNNVGAGQTGIATIANTYETHSGTNVAGTIGGKPATGIGRVLTADATDSLMTGLKLEITAASPVSGTFSYTPGLAQRLVSVVENATNPVSGYIQTRIDGLKSTVSDIETQISEWDDRLVLREQTLRRQFTSLELALSQMQAQGSFLGQALANPSRSS